MCVPLVPFTVVPSSEPCFRDRLLEVSKIAEVPKLTAGLVTVTTNIISHYRAK
jgi:hypothetical protein